MVSSRLVPSVVYHEIKKIHPEDKNKESSVYELDILGTTVAVVLGQPKYEHSKKGVVYFYIYTIKKSKICSVIGVFECSTDKIASLYEDGEVNLEELDDPIIFSGINEKTIKRKKCSPDIFKKSKQLSKEEMEDVVKEITGENIFDENEKKSKTNKDEEEDEEDELFKLKLPPDAKRSKEKNESKELISEGIFKVDKNCKSENLIEESELDAKRIKKEFKEIVSTSWIEKYMKNNNYKILENEGGGDCLFACIRDAMKTIGKHTTVDKLRAILSDNLTEDIFKEQREIFLQFETEIKETEAQIQELKKKNINLKKRAAAITDTHESEYILKQAKELISEHKKLMDHLRETKNLQMETTGEIRNIDTLEKMRAYIRSSSYWAEEWAIAELEHALNFKLIILSEDSYSENALDNVLFCGIADEKIKSRSNFKPDHYIMVNFGNMHYQLLSYKDKKILEFKELPYDIKTLIINKCLEHNSGSYYLIQDFRNLKSKYGIDPDEGESDEYDTPQGDLFENDVRFIIGSNARKTTKPGKANGEKISVAKLSTFVELAKSKDWRRKLDDQWMGESIIINNHKWASVKHYMEGAKYSKGHPDIYLQYSLDSGSKLSKDPKINKKENEKQNLGEDTEPQRMTPKPDADYFLGREDEERELAIHAKFSQHEELRILLKNTHKALLLKKNKYGEPASPDYILMKVRKEL